MPGQKEVNWNSGENVGQADLNLMQRMARAVQSDWMFGALGSFDGSRASLIGAINRTQHLYCMGDSCAPYPGGGAMQVTNLGGPIVQYRTGAPTNMYDQALPADWGTEPYALVYWPAPGELLQTHAIGGAQARRDLVSIQLSTTSADIADQETRLQKQVVGGGFVISSAGFIKRRKVICTVTVTQGVAAASDPSWPALPANNVPWYTLTIPAGMNSVVPADLDLADYRMPLGTFVQDVYAADQVTNGHRSAAMTVTNGTAICSATFTANGQEIYFVPRGIVQPHACRLIGVGALCGINVSGNTQFRVARFNANNGGTYNDIDETNGVVKTPTGNFQLGTLPVVPGGGGVNTKYNEASSLVPYAAGAGSNIPVWGHGWLAGYALRSQRLGIGVGTDNAWDSVGVRLAQTTVTFATIHLVRLIFAGMP